MKSVPNIKPFLKRALREDPHLNVRSYKNGFYLPDRMAKKEKRK